MTFTVGVYICGESDCMPGLFVLSDSGGGRTRGGRPSIYWQSPTFLENTPWSCFACVNLIQLCASLLIW